MFPLKKGLSSPLGQSYAMGKWYNGATAAYLPKGASSLATSYVNLVNPGTYDAFLGIAPTLSVNGWSFNGTQYLRTGLTPTGNNWSSLIRIQSANVQASNQYVFGYLNASQTYGMMLGFRTNLLIFFNTSPAGYSIIPVTFPCVLGVAGQSCYLNGNNVATSTSGTGIWDELYVGLYNKAGTPSGGTTNTISALGVWNYTLSPSAMAEKSAAILAL